MEKLSDCNCNAGARLTCGAAPSILAKLQLRTKSARFEALKTNRRSKENRLAIKWLFIYDSTGQSRWEVRGAEGPIATSGKRFETLEGCVSDARLRGFHGPAEPPVVTESLPGARNARALRTASR